MVQFRRPVSLITNNPATIFYLVVFVLCFKYLIPVWCHCADNFRKFNNLKSLPLDAITPFLMQIKKRNLVHTSKQIKHHPPKWPAALKPTLSPGTISFIPTGKIELLENTYGVCRTSIDLLHVLLQMKSSVLHRQRMHACCLMGSSSWWGCSCCSIASNRSLDGNCLRDNAERYMKVTVLSLKLVTILTSK